MERRAVEVGGIPKTGAVLVVEMAKTQTRLYLATHNYSIIRDGASRATTDQELALLRAGYHVGATDLVSTEANTEVGHIAKELGLDADEERSVRSEFYERLAIVQRSVPGRRSTPSRASPSRADAPVAG